MTKRFLWVLMAVCAVLPAVMCFAGEDTITQVSTIDALMTGVYDGPTTLGELRTKGDFGLGTFATLDGEMVLLDGVFYQVTSTGAVLRPGPEVKTPFAAVTFFKADRTIPLKKGVTFMSFTAQTEKVFPTRNAFYAIKIMGTFGMVKARSVPAQKKPYPQLAEVVKTQPVFEFTDVSGTMVGFWCPSFAKGVNVPGYHLHFLRADGKMGGHVLDFAVNNAVMEIDDSREFSLILPDDAAFDKADLEPDRAKELKAVEK
ncbi:MAG TPA: acetolactate decarboxylase [Deltaproteobacteria bacterium]|nr:acetolactate decarboxylase [Deltaproteobacteria bacterium]